MKKRIINPLLTCSIRTTSHRLNEESFSLFKTTNSPIHFNNIKEHSFDMSCAYKSDRHRNIDHFVMSTHLLFSTFLMAINISTIGYFNWILKEHISPQYSLSDIAYNKIVGHISFQEQHNFPADVIDITSYDLKRAILLLGVLAKKSESVLVQEYLKGILHLDINFLYFDFRKEAFGNFYRSFENVVTEKILKIKKLTNELKDFQQALSKIGVDEKIIEEFKLLYVLRSNQVMHAQKKQVNIEIDDVYKMKVILDGVLYKIYKPIWEDQLPISI
jgi:hypothetical protein